MTLDKKEYAKIQYYSKRGHLFWNICPICLKLKYRLDTHHIDRNTKNNEPSNLLSVCVTCHKKIHGGHFVSNVHITNNSNWGKLYRLTNQELLFEKYYNKCHKSKWKNWRLELNHKL